METPICHPKNADELALILLKQHPQLGALESLRKMSGETLKEWEWRTGDRRFSFYFQWRRFEKESL